MEQAEERKLKIAVLDRREAAAQQGGAGQTRGTTTTEGGGAIDREAARHPVPAEELGHQPVEIILDSISLDIFS